MVSQVSIEVGVPYKTVFSFSLKHRNVIDNPRPFEQDGSSC